MNKPTAAQIRAIKPGDRITFRAATRATGNAKATRKVSRAYCEHSNSLEVTSFAGWRNFAVRPLEILNIHTATEQEQTPCPSN
jgi:hypothetical protein